MPVRKTLCYAHSSHSHRLLDSPAKLHSHEPLLSACKVRTSQLPSSSTLTQAKNSTLNPHEEYNILSISPPHRLPNPTLSTPNSHIPSHTPRAPGVLHAFSARPRPTIKGTLQCIASYGKKANTTSAAPPATLSPWWF